VISDFSDKMTEREIVNCCGCDYFILKPFTCAALIGAIKRVCGIGTGGIAQAEESKSGITQGRGRKLELELEVTKILHRIGVPVHIKGYNYLRHSIMLSIDDPSVMDAVTKVLYPSVATNFSTTVPRVERAIRHAIGVVWGHGNIEVLNMYLGCTVNNFKCKPTNSEFIAIISDMIRLQMKSAS
jgi:two-component system response regulator (stage 0 sporulation protein A)